MIPVSYTIVELGDHFFGLIVLEIIFWQAMASIPDSHSHHLDQFLDWDNEGVDKDLTEIASHMINWEEVLAVHLKLTRNDISDIKEKNSQKPELQR